LTQLSTWQFGKQSASTFGLEEKIGNYCKNNKRQIIRKMRAKAGGGKQTKWWSFEAIPDFSDFLFSIG
jgi:hypothetical protein